MTPREVALSALTACEKQGAWSDGYLKKAIRSARLDSRDAALCTRMCFGVLQNRMLLDYYVAQCSTTKPEKMEAGVRNILRLGAYQLLMMDRVPDHAAVSQSVELAKRSSRNPRVPGLVNAVLRSLLRRWETLTAPEAPAIRYSHPQWLVDAFQARLGQEETLALLAADNGQPHTCAQVNTMKIDTPSLQKRLEQEGVGAKVHPWLPDCLLLEGTGDLERLGSYQEGLFYVQDAAARLAVLAGHFQPGMQVLDACAAPGGKSFAAAIAMKGQGSILSCDIHPHKIQLIEAGAARLGLSCIHGQQLDAKACKGELLNRFDLVIADVPCSGLGIIRKKPDIRYKEPGPLERLPQIQGEILENVSGYVRPGGELIYATCTLLERENELVVRDFIDRHNNFTLVPLQLPGPFKDCGQEGMVTCWPHRHDTDGFFFAKLRRLS